MSFKKFADRLLRLRGANPFPPCPSFLAWTNEPIIIIIINNIIYLYKTSTYKFKTANKNLVHLFKVKFQNMNRVNLLFYKAFLPLNRVHFVIVK